MIWSLRSRYYQTLGAKRVAISHGYCFFSTVTAWSASKATSRTDHSNNYFKSADKANSFTDLPRSFGSNRNIHKADALAYASSQLDISEDPKFHNNALSGHSKTFATNQHLPTDAALNERLRSMLWEFKAPIKYAFGYGSGVFSQSTTKSSKQQVKPMIDMIFGVKSTQHWHSLNLRQHPDHYSFLGSLGSAFVSYTQDSLGAGVYFNPYVDINGTLVKYGVVNIDTLYRDLTTWDTLYMAGRLHKPINIIRNDPHFKLAVQLNCRSALRVALLLLPRTFFELELYTIIAGISYSGDPRMKLFTENPHKVHNIVNNQLHNFRDIYWPLIQQLPNTYFSKESATWNDPASELMIVQDMDPVQRGNMVCRLPNSFRDRLYFEYQKKYAISNLEFRKMISTSEGDEIISRNQSNEFDQRIAMDMENIQEEIGNAIKSTIWWPSTTQSLKGLITAGPVKSWKYLGEKMTKWKESKKSQGDG